MGAEDNKAVVGGTYEAFERGDVEAIFAVLADDLVWVNHTSGSPFAGMQEMFEAIDKELENPKLRVQALVADGDHVVALLEQDYTSKSTGAAFSGPLIHVCEVHDGRITRVDEYEGDL